MTKRNADIRQYAKDKSVYLYEVADELNVSYSTLLGWLRRRLTPETSDKIRRTIDGISQAR